MNARLIKLAFQLGYEQAQSQFSKQAFNVPVKGLLKTLGILAPTAVATGYFGNLAFKNWKDKIKAQSENRGHLQVLDRQSPTYRVAGFNKP